MLNEKLRNLIPYVPAEGEYAVRLDANESCFSPSKEELSQLCEALFAQSLNRYPDPYAKKLITAFSDFYGIASDSVVAGNGSDELIFVIMNAFLQKGDKVITFTQDFSMYDFYASLCETDCIKYTKNADLSVSAKDVCELIRAGRPRLVIFSNPCNPTSLGMTKQEVRQIIAACDNTVVVIDEAYMDFWDETLLYEAASYSNVILLRTASKAVGIAALRLGFAIANDVLIAALRAAKSPYNVNAVSQAMGEVFYQNKELILQRIGTIRDSRKDLQCKLQVLEGKILKKVLNSKTNFILIETDFASILYNKLKEESILVRNISNQYLRITAGTESENQRLLAALSQIIKEL